MLLENKNAVIYGGGGSIGGAVARAFGREGATVFLTGRTQDKLDRVAEDVRAAGGKAETALADALDPRAAFGRFFSDLGHEAADVAGRVVTGSPDVASSTNLGGPQRTSRRGWI